MKRNYNLKSVIIAVSVAAIMIIVQLAKRRKEET